MSQIASTDADPNPCAEQITPLYEIQEYKIWKGIDPDKPCWRNINSVSYSDDDMYSLVEYLERNNPERIYRVIKAKY